MKALEGSAVIPKQLALVDAPSTTALAEDAGKEKAKAKAKGKGQLKLNKVNRNYSALARTSISIGPGKRKSYVGTDPVKLLRVSTRKAATKHPRS